MDSVVVTPDYNVQDMPADVTRSAPMYSDIHQKHVAVKGLGVGDTLEYQVTFHTFKAEVPGHFWLEYSFEKTLHRSRRTARPRPSCRQDRQRFQLRCCNTVVTTAGGRKVYQWASSNLARPDPDAPPKSTKHLKPVRAGNNVHAVGNR